MRGRGITPRLRWPGWGCDLAIERTVGAGLGPAGESEQRELRIAVADFGQVLGHSPLLASWLDQADLRLAGGGSMSTSWQPGRAEQPGHVFDLAIDLEAG